MITLSLIARDAETDLDELMEETSPFFGEITVLDTGSTDATKIVAKRLGAVVGEFEWNGNFADARNAALDLASGDWIFSLDTDERISRHDLESLENLVALGPDAFVLTTRNYCPSPGPGRFPSPDDDPLAPPGSSYFETPKVRLFRKRPEIRWEGEIHEVVDFAVARAGLVSDYAPIIVHHFGQMKDRAASRYEKAIISAVERGSRHPPLLIAAGGILEERGAPEKAALLYTRALASEPRYGAAAIALGRAMVALGRIEDAVKVLEAGVKASPGDPAVMAALVSTHIHGNNLEAASIMLDAAERLHPGDGRFAPLRERIGSGRPPG